MASLRWPRASRTLAWATCQSALRSAWPTACRILSAASDLAGGDLRAGLLDGDGRGGQPGLGGLVEGVLGGGVVAQGPLDAAEVEALLAAVLGLLQEGQRLFEAAEDAEAQADAQGLGRAAWPRRPASAG